MHLYLINKDYICKISKYKYEVPMLSKTNWRNSKKYYLLILKGSRCEIFQGCYRGGWLQPFQDDVFMAGFG